jgi:hypothetical protein
LSKKRPSPKYIRGIGQVGQNIELGQILDAYLEGHPK